jgi:hypothetical protein
MVELLLDAGTDVNASTWAESGEASEALFAAAKVNHAEFTELLLAHGAVVDGTDTGGRSPLMHSAYFNSPDVIRVLLVHGANIDRQDVSGLTALHGAVRDNNLEAAQVLVENGAALDIETNMGQTPLDMRTDEAINKLLRTTGAKESVATSQEDILGEWKSPLGYYLTFGPTESFNQTIKFSSGGGFYHFDGEQLVLDSKDCRIFDTVAQDWEFFECTASYTVYTTKDGDSAVELRFEPIDDPDKDRRTGLVRHPWKRVEDC